MNKMKTWHWLILFFTIILALFTYHYLTKHQGQSVSSAFMP